MQVIQVVFGNRLSRTSVSLTQSSSFTNVSWGRKIALRTKRAPGQPSNDSYAGNFLFNSRYIDLAQVL